MKKKIVLIIILTLAFAGVFVCFKCYAEQKPWNVHVTVRHGNVRVQYDLNENVTAGVDGAQQGCYLSAKGKLQMFMQLQEMQFPDEICGDYVLPGFKSICESFNHVNAPKVDSSVDFGKEGFKYTKGQDGVAIDVSELFRRMIFANCGDEIMLPIVVDRAVTVESLVKDTSVKGKFSTSFSLENANRAFNVRKAADAIDGITIAAEQKFSFNDVVGERSAERGYKNAKVIVQGQYVDGIGGGVCQVSTTLYNALLLSDVIPVAHAHSLVPSYVAAGFDATVSYGNLDLSFTNETGSSLYVSAKVKGNSLTVTVYGVPNRYKIVRHSTEERIPFSVVEIFDPVSYPEVVYDDTFVVKRNGSDGVESKSYLVYYDGDQEVARKLIRTDCYKKVDKVVVRGKYPRN